MKTLITHPNFTKLWESICENNDIKKAKISFDRFADNWPNFFIDNLKNDIEWKDVYYIGDFSNIEQVFENYAIIRWVLEYLPNSLTIFMPFFPVATMERIDNKWEIATANIFAEIFSNLPSAFSSKPVFHLLDIHALSLRFYFDSHKVWLDLHTAMSLIKDKISKDTCIVFPDDWAKKRFSVFFPEYDLVLCIKRRKAEKRELILLEWDVEGRELLIVDDLIQSWGTIIECSKLLKRLWAKSISAFATHWVFPGDSHEKLAWYLDKLYVTNSIPENTKRSENIHNIEVLDIVSIFEKIIFFKS